MATEESSTRSGPNGHEEIKLPKVAQRPEDQFLSFAKESVGLIVALTGLIPVLMDYLGILNPPKVSVGDKEVSKVISVMATVASSLVFLALFWTRDKVARSWSVVIGIVLLFAGLGLLVYATLHSSFNTALTSVAYLLGFPSSIGGAALVFLFGFVRHQERPLALWEIVPRLGNDQWASLLSFARTLLSVMDSIEKLPINDKSKSALKKSADHVIVEYNSMLSKLEKGMLEIRGPVMDTIFGYFMDAVKQQFRALSRDDLDFWASSESDRYLDANEKLLRRGCMVERIFVISRNRMLSQVDQDAIRKQIETGIKVCFTYTESTTDIVDDERDLDFGLFDEEAVSFWRFARGRVFRISTSANQRKKYRTIYEKVKATCIKVPTKQGPNRTQFESMQDFDGWLSQLRTQGKAD